MERQPKPNAMGTCKCLLPMCDDQVEIRRNKNGELYYFCPSFRGQSGCNGSVKFGDLSDPSEIPGFVAYKAATGPQDAPQGLRNVKPAPEAPAEPSQAPAPNVAPPAGDDDGGWGLDF